MIGIGDYIIYRTSLTNYSLKFNLTNYQTQHHTGTYARGYYGISILIPKCNGIYTQYKRQIRHGKNTRTKYHSKIIQNASFTHLVGPIGLHKS